MGTIGDAGRRRMAGLVGLAALVLALATGVALMLRDDTSTTPLPAGSAGAIARDPVLTESITVSNGRVEAIARHDDQIVIIDGTATSDGHKPWDPDAEPTTRVWVIDADEPDEAQPFDLPSVGPRVVPHVWWWDGQWAIAAMPCPEPWDPAEIQREYDEMGDVERESCGVEVVDIFRFDPVSRTVTEVVAGIDAESDRGTPLWVHPVSTNDDRTLLRRKQGDLSIVSLDGTITPIDEVPGGDNTPVLPAGESFVALPLIDEGDDQGELRPAESFFRLLRLDGTTWVPEDLPPSGYERRATSRSSTLDGYIATFGRQQGRFSVNVPLEPNQEILLLHVDQEGAVDWELVTLDGLPDELDARGYFQVVDGELLVGPDRDRRWNGSAWVPSPAEEEGWDVYVEDLTGTLHLAPGHDWWDPLHVVLTTTP
jgi:hypothetical protein